MYKPNVRLFIMYPVSNMVEFMRELINRALQHVFLDFEFIILDNASDYDTDLVLRSYVDKGINFIRNDYNIGDYAYSNKGMQSVLGKYIIVTNTDDVGMLEWLERQIDYLKEYSDVLAVGSDCIFLSNGKRQNVACSYKNALMALLVNSSLIHPILTVRTNILRQLNRYNELYSYLADYDLVCRLALLGKVENLDEPLMRYRWHSSQISVLNKEEQKSYADEIRGNYAGIYQSL